MNFFEHQAAARRGSGRLVLLFLLAVAGIVLAVDLATLLFTGSWGATAAATVATLLVIALGSLYRIASLRGGGAVVAAQMGGTLVPEDTREPSLRRLRNVVEEIAIASGVPVPRLFVMEQEAGINAFAAGYSPSDAAIAVTRGALDRLNRDELQGVIAHEFAHVLNGDMRLNIRLIGLLFGILMLSLIGQRILIYGRLGRSRDGTPILVAALVAMAVGAIGVFFGRMIKAGVSRQRELLADASAVQFTRQTRGLAGALKKIGGLDAGSKLQDKADAEEVSHMLFGPGAALSGLFATHPPLVERIRRLEPTFDARQLQQLEARWRTAPPDGLAEDLALGLAGRDVVAGGPPPLPSAGAQLAVTPPMVAGQVAAPGDDDYRRAHDLVESLGPDLRTLARQREAVMPLLLGLLLDTDAVVAARQRSEIVARCVDIYPLLKTELFLRYEEDELPELIDALLAELLRQQLVEARDGGYWVNPGNQMRLLLLAESIQETLQRYAIVLTRMLAQPHIEAEQLEADGLMMAERLGTLHGINAPEFFDQKLFSTLIHTLRSEGYLDPGCKPDLGRFQALADNIVPLLSNKIRRTIQAGNRL